ncbi:MAG TPA: type II toxin-antitoxin system VapC family toxin [Candidatus Limnocylindrales bacterium]|nr:type II toxin-antitoxin system VapC family toxin [Candidatus Limnocylindrales bacterium]
MRFWDSSALMPLLVAEASSAPALAALTADPEIVAWWGTGVELVSALSRLERDGLLEGPPHGAAFERLDRLELAWREIQPGDRLREIAVRLVRTHAVRTLDALQLAAAIVAAEERPASLPLVTLDRRLANVAQREGFAVVVPGR